MINAMKRYVKILLVYEDGSTAPAVDLRSNLDYLFALIASDRLDEAQALVRALRPLWNATESRGE